MPWFGKRVERDEIEADIVSARTSREEAIATRKKVESGRPRIELLVDAVRTRRNLNGFSDDYAISATPRRMPSADH